MFDLHIDENTQTAYGTTFYKGYIVIEDFEESFLASTDYWKPREYMHQWLESINKLKDGSLAVPLITSMNNLYSANYIESWTLYRFQEQIRIRNQMLFLEQHREAVISGNLDIIVPPYNIHSDDGKEISEWLTSMESIADFKAKLNNELGREH